LTVPVWAIVSTAGAATVTLGLVVSTTVMFTVCSAVRPAELVTLFLIRVEPSGKTYTDSWIGAPLETRKVWMEDVRLAPV
jgi:hypothetical protein